MSSPAEQQPVAAAAAAAGTGSPMPASAADVIAAARQLLLLALRLYGCAEEAGVFAAPARAGTARTSTLRDGGASSSSIAGAVQPNVRFWLDAVLLRVLGVLGPGWALQELRPTVVGTQRSAAALQRVLGALPAVDRLRCAGLALAEASAMRAGVRAAAGSGVGSGVSAAAAAAVSSLQDDWHGYFGRQGRGQDRMLRVDGMDVIRCVDIGSDFMGVGG